MLNLSQNTKYRSFFLIFEILKFVWFEAKIKWCFSLWQLYFFCQHLQWIELRKKNRNELIKKIVSMKSLGLVQNEFENFYQTLNISLWYPTVKTRKLQNRKSTWRLKLWFKKTNVHERQQLSQPFKFKIDLLDF